MKAPDGNGTSEIDPKENFLALTLFIPQTHTKHIRFVCLSIIYAKFSFVNMFFGNSKEYFGILFTTNKF